MEEDCTQRVARGTSQGGVVSPVLANIYMNRFLKFWRLIGCINTTGTDPMVVCQTPISRLGLTRDNLLRLHS